VENRLGDLWSLFEFLNPGLLGTASVFRAYTTTRKNGSEPPVAAADNSLQILSKALRPFILRRTKEQVARELPAKTEQTIYCELEPDQRRLYNELRAHYRESLLSTKSGSKSRECKSWRRCCGSGRLHAILA
jgi:SNF2 family DNA or RNA helicase